MTNVSKADHATLFQSKHIDEIFAQAEGTYKGAPLPLEVEISTVDSCTRACSFCPRGDESVAPNTRIRLTEELWTKVSSELKEIGFKGLIMLSGFGENMMHKNIIDIVRAFSFTFVNLNTNGDLLTRAKIDALREAGIYKIMISIYEAESWDKFLALQKGNEDLVIIRNRYENQESLFNNRGGSLYKEERGGMCNYPFYMVMIDANGDVFPCCHEWTRKLKMGNLYQHTLWQIWTSSSYHTVRRKMLEGKRDLYPCRECNVNGTYRGGKNVELHTKLQKF